MDRTKADVSGDLSGPQRVAIAALIGGNDTDAAAAARVTTRTVRRWRTEPAFKRALDAARHEVLCDATRALAGAAAQAVGVLRATMADDGAPVAARVRAADVILSRLLDLVATVELEPRIAALEDKL